MMWNPLKITVFLLLISTICFAQEFTDSYVTLYSPARDLEIDGQLQDWLSHQPMNLHYQSLVRGSRWGGIDDLSGSVWLAADAKGLYLAADLRDSNFLGKPEGKEIWESDSLVLTLHFADSLLESKRFYILISREKTQPVYSILLEEEGTTSIVDDFAIELAIADRGDYAPMMEMFIAWENFDEKFPAPSRFDFNIEIRDYDGRNSFKTIAWKPIFATDARRSALATAVVEYDEISGSGISAGSASINTVVQQVNLSVSVVDRSNEPKLDMAIEEISIFENGVEQKIKEFRLETVPITVGLLIDKSLSMTMHLDDVKESTKEFISSMRPEDRAFVIAFSHEIDELKDFEGDAEQAKLAIDEIVADGDTALNATLLHALLKVQYLREKKVLVVFSDGENDPREGKNFFGREILMSEIIEEAKRNDVAIYPIAFQMGNTNATMGLRQLADNSGGRIFSPVSIGQLVSAYREIAIELKSRYRISYISSNPDLDGQWREITVQPKDKTLRARTKKGYFAQKR
jgi:VWFA-related protein